MRKTTNYGLALYDTTDKMTITAEENSLNHNMELIDEALKEKATIKNMTDYIEEHKKELKGADGKDGLDGKDGYTPIKGKDYFDGKDGVDGTNGIDGKNGTNGLDGQDGYSPTAKVETTSTGATITITDKNGTTTTTITNGKDGTNGIDGKDGTNGKDGADGYTPTKGNDYWTEADKTEIKEYVKGEIPTKVSELTNDSGYLTEEDKGEIMELLIKPKIVTSIDEMTDHTKKYVLNGYIYESRTVTVEGETISPDLFEPTEAEATNYLNKRMSGSTGSESASNGSFITDFISVTDDNGKSLLTDATSFIFRLNNSSVLFTGQSKVVYFNSSKSRVGANIFKSTNTTQSNGETVSDVLIKGDSSSMLPTDWSTVAYVKLQYQLGTTEINYSNIKDCVITCDAFTTVTEPTTKTEFVNTGERYEDTGNDALISTNATNIAGLQTDVSTLKTNVSTLQTDVDTLKNSSDSGTTSLQSDTVLYAIGDSITAGLYAGGTSGSWVAHVIKHNGYSVSSQNLGVSGIGFVRQDPTTNKVIKDIVNANNFANANLVTVAVGINDWQNSCDIATVKTEMEYCFNKILTDNPYCKIFFITPFNKNRGEQATNWALGYKQGNLTLEEFVAEQVAVCESIGIEVIDMTHNSVINKYNLTSVLYDNTHPDETCHIALGKELAEKITFK